MEGNTELVRGESNGQHEQIHVPEESNNGPNRPTEPATIEPTGRGRYRSWCFTANNYDETLLALLDHLACRYLIYGKEISPTTSTPHLQGYVVFSSGCTLAACRTRLPRCHLQVARGTPSQNYDYCSKDGHFTERGTRPMDPSERGQLERDRYALAWASATQNNLLEIPEDIRIRHYSTLKRIARDYQKTLTGLEGVCGTWIHGESGSGKTRSVYAHYPDLYPKPISKWWDGYQEHEIVLIDDVDPECCKFLQRHLKIWTDRNPFVAEDKGGSRIIRPQRIIITSQYTIEECFEEEKTRVAWNRRCIVIEKILGQDIIL